jgi:hypothetical protein
MIREGENEMQAIISFITGPLNTVAWLYVLLPCVFVGGLLFTIRNRGIQFAKFGHIMKQTAGKMFQKQEAGEGAPPWRVRLALETLLEPVRQSRWVDMERCFGFGLRLF